MPFADVIHALISRPLGRILVRPVRELMEEVLEEHGYAHPRQVERLREEIEEAERRAAEQEERIAALEDKARNLHARTIEADASSSEE